MRWMIYFCMLPLLSIFVVADGFCYRSNYDPNYVDFPCWSYSNLTCELEEYTEFCKFGKPCMFVLRSEVCKWVEFPIMVNETKEENTTVVYSNSPLLNIATKPKKKKSGDSGIPLVSCGSPILVYLRPQGSYSYFYYRNDEFVRPPLFNIGDGEGFRDLDGDGLYDVKFEKINLKYLNYKITPLWCGKGEYIIIN